MLGKILAACQDMLRTQESPRQRTVVHHTAGAAVCIAMFTGISSWLDLMELDRVL